MDIICGFQQHNKKKSEIFIFLSSVASICKVYIIINFVISLESVVEAENFPKRGQVSYAYIVSMS